MPTGHKKTPPNRSSARRNANRPLGGPHARHPARPGCSCGCRPRSACIWRTPFSRMLKCGPCAPNPAGRAFRFPYGSCTCRASQNVSNKKKHPAFQQGASCLHDPYGNRTAEILSKYYNFLYYRRFFLAVMEIFYFMRKKVRYKSEVKKKFLLLAAK